MRRAPRPAVEFGITQWAAPGGGGAAARRSEELGFDIHALGVNECMSADVFGELRLGAEATTSIRLMTALANFVTRHPVVVAAGIAGLDVMSGGRATCGVGKGDSAVSMVGRAPQRHADYLECVRMARAYLRGETVEIDGALSRLSWLPEDWPPIELEMFASGPRSIAAAAAHADRITLAVGASEERISWALRIIDDTLRAVGRSRGDVRIGACIPYAVDDDPERADVLLRPMVLGWAHMSSFPGMDLSQQPELLRKVTTAARDGYSYDYHTNATAPQNPLLSGLDPAFVRWFGVAGPPATVAERLLALYDLGISHFMVATDGDQRDRFALEVAPLVRAAVARRAPAAAGG